VYNLCRLKTDISVVLTVKNGFDPHVIIELEDELNRGPYLWLWLWLCCISSISFSVDSGMNLYLSNQVLIIKLDQLKLLIVVSQSAFP
jgi:hypothetical protein